jgi:(methylthio)acryloyl-CoA hydratase
MTAFTANLPKALAASRQGDIAILRRPDKRNALNDTLVLGLKTFLDSLPADVKVILLHAEGDHFSAGLDLSELTETSGVEGIEQSRMWPLPPTVIAIDGEN